MLVKKVQKRIEELNMIFPNDRIVVGLSGGADSVCLLLMLCELREKMNFSVEVVHVEHGIRGEDSRQDAAFVEKLCKKWNICHRVVAINVPDYAASHGLGLEEAARIMRYEIFEQVAKERKAKIALAHHMEDNAETILFQMARGSSLTGLCGMLPMRQSENGVIYIRPLLSLHRQEIESYLEEKGQDYCVDSTNQELEYSRNYIRNVILPEFNKVNNQTVAHISETAAHLQEIRGFIDEQIEEYWQQVATVSEDIVLDLLKLKELHVVLQKELFYKAIGIMTGGKKDISSIHVEQMLELSANQSGKTVMLPNGVFAIKENATIRLLARNLKQEKEYMSSIEVTADTLKGLLQERERMCLPLGKSGCMIEISMFEKADLEDEIPRKAYTKWMDYDKINNGFCIRTRQSGDYLIYDEFGHRKKLKQYFIDEKIPVTKRDLTWLLTQEDKVLWVIGGRISEDIKVTGDTKIIMEVTIKEEK